MIDDRVLSARARSLLSQVRDFVRDEVMPAEPVFAEQLAAAGDPHHHPPVMEQLKDAARRAGLWNLFLPDDERGAGLSNLEYAPMAEAMGRSHLGAEACNCNAPDTGNMEVLARYGSPEQQRTWLQPLLDGEIRSCFAMTEPDVASSDARNIQASIVRDGDGYVLNGRKWWTSGALRQRCRLAIFMGKSDPDADAYRQQSMILVPMDAPGVTVVRDLTVFGYTDPEGHGEVDFSDVRVPADNLLAGEGEGFAIAQGRLGPGRVHHCMRLIGQAERALELMCQRAGAREAFGKALMRHGTVADDIARSRVEIDRAREQVLRCAAKMDAHGNKAAGKEIAAIKVTAPAMACDVIDRAIQVHGGAGVSQDTPLARMYAGARSLRLADGPDEVHLMTVARQELREQLDGDRR